MITADVSASPLVRLDDFARHGFMIRLP